MLPLSNPASRKCSNTAAGFQPCPLSTNGSPKAWSWPSTAIRESCESNWRLIVRSRLIECPNSSAVDGEHRTRTSASRIASTYSTRPPRCQHRGHKLAHSRRCPLWVESGHYVTNCHRAAGQGLRCPLSARSGHSRAWLVRRNRPHPWKSSRSPLLLRNRHPTKSPAPDEQGP